MGFAAACCFQKLPMGLALFMRLCKQRARLAHVCRVKYSVENKLKENGNQAVVDTTLVRLVHI